MSVIWPETVQEEIADEQQRFATRSDIGDTRGVIQRLLAYLGGNPVTYFNRTSVSNVDFQRLPDESRAMQAVLQVTVAPIIYRTDGTNPGGATEQILTVGTIITLTGQPSIKGFVFAASGAAAASVAINYYD